jgi:hypothetical protein
MMLIDRGADHRVVPRFHFNHAGVLHPKAIPKLWVKNTATCGIDGCQWRHSAIDEGARNTCNASRIKVQNMLVGSARMRRLLPLYPIVICANQTKHRRVGRWKTVIDAFGHRIDA